MNKLKQFLKSIKLFEQEALSISNLLVLALLVNILVVPNVYSFGALFLSLINYNVKKYFNFRVKAVSDETNKKISRLESEVSSLISASELRKLR
jgi:hypothetical protein